MFVSKWVVTLAASLVLSATMASAEPGQPARGASSKRAGHVYLLRGLGNVFSLGMDQLASKLNRAGVAATAHTFIEWSSLAETIGTQYKSGKHGPVILMGHSAGADSTIQLASRLNDLGVPVRLIVNFDPVSPGRVPKNVGQVVNYYLSNWWGSPVRPDRKFHGALANVDLRGKDVGHFDIDKSERLHRQAIAKVMGVLGRGSAKPSQPSQPSQTSETSETSETSKN